MGSSAPEHTGRFTQALCTFQGLGAIPWSSLRGAVRGLGAQHERRRGVNVSLMLHHSSSTRLLLLCALGPCELTAT